MTFARHFAYRLRRDLGESVTRPRRKRRPRLEMTLRRRDGATVEELALEAFANRGQAGFFSENWLWRGLFGLAFWDVVFAPVAGAFQHPFQYGPLDLSSPDFRKTRAAAVAARLDELAVEARPGARLLAVYDAKQGTANRLVAWHEELRPFFELALARLTGRQLALVCDRMSRDLRRYRVGLPDLFIVDDEVESGFRLYEVKAPGDQLRPEQGSWLDALNDGGIPASVLKVRWG